MTRAHGAGAAVHIVPETRSTNADLLDRIAAGDPPPSGEWLVADRQTAGRGREGRAWLDGVGNFMGSTAVRLTPGDPAPSSLSLVASLALLEAVLPYVPHKQTLVLKWPNDLLVRGAKVAGILLERQGEWVVIGIGVNLTSAPTLPDRQTAALSRWGPSPDRDAFAASLAKNMAMEVGRWRTYGLAAVVRRWLAAAHPVGTPLVVRPPGDEVLNGLFGGLADDGSLLLNLPNGVMRTIFAGDVMLAGKDAHCC